MGLGIRCTVTSSQIRKYARRCEDIVYDEFIKELTKIGQEAETKIQNRSYDESWVDVTGNLRSSIGYAVYSRGKIVAQSAFDFGHGEEGKLAGKAYVERIASRYKSICALAVVAGMDYAKLVEAKENKDVLASVQLQILSEIDGRLKAAKERAVAKINRLNL